jgi:hypothetical protein
MLPTHSSWQAEVIAVDDTVREIEEKVLGASI